MAKVTTAAGDHALQALTLGLGNTAIGTFSLFRVTAGSFNTAVGAGALDLNTADSNTANGTAALEFNDAAEQNTATGAFALFSHVSGNGSFNTADGACALGSNIGGDNTAVGVTARSSNTTGNNNTAVGLSALANNITGSNNIALGTFAGQSVTTSSNVICIGVQGSNTDNSCFIGQIFNASSPGGSADFIDASNRLGTVVSSKRFKENIQQMGAVSEALLALKPVSFHYKKQIDPAGKSQFGLVAADVEVNPDLVVRDKEGRPYSVRYDQVNAMLLNEFLKEHQTVQELRSTAVKQEATIAELKSTVAQQQKGIEALTAGLQEVSAQLATASPSRGGLEAGKFAIGRIRRGGTAPQVVNNP